MLTIKPFLSVKDFLYLGVGLFVVLNTLHASTSVTATVSSNVDPARYGDSDINESNTITITITHNGTDGQSAPDGFLDGVAQLWYVFSETGVAPDINTACTGADAANANCARPWIDPDFAKNIGGNTSVMTVTGADLATIDAVAGQEGNNFDLKVVLSSASGGPSDVTLQINNWVNVDETPYLSYDLVDNYFGTSGAESYPTGSFFDDSPKNSGSHDGFFNESIIITIHLL